jgi:hypothetical protein
MNVSPFTNVKVSIYNDNAKRAGLIEATPRCPRCKLRQSKPASACPSNADNRCTCCDLCRRECALDAKGSLLKRS